MNVPKRKGNAPAEATQELQALDVLEIVETLKTKTAGPGPRKRITSNSSIAPVGLDLAPQGEDVAVADEEVNPTMEVRLPTRRRRLGGVVIGAVAGCALILLAAGIARVGHASSPPPTVQATPTTPAPATTSLDSTTATTPDPATPPVTAGTTSTTTTSSTGTVRLDRPAVAGRVWLDGKKLSASSALVSCGTHQIKVGRGRTHSIDVPCGGELGVSK
jgi:hypothetical protein